MVLMSIRSDRARPTAVARGWVRILTRYECRFPSRDQIAESRLALDAGKGRLGRFG